jgi:hypothetical protein
MTELEQQKPRLPAEQTTVFGIFLAPYRVVRHATLRRNAEVLRNRELDDLRFREMMVAIDRGRARKMLTAIDHRHGGIPERRLSDGCSAPLGHLLNHQDWRLVRLVVTGPDHPQRPRA